MKIISDKVRTGRDFAFYVFKKASFQSLLRFADIILEIVGFIILIIGLPVAIISAQLVCSVLGAVIFFIGLIWNRIKFGKYSKYELKRTNAFDITKIIQCESEFSSAKGTVEFTREELILSENSEGKKDIDWIFMSHELNKYLCDTSYTLKLEDQKDDSVKKEQITRLIKGHWDTLSRYLIHKAIEAFKNGKAFYNEDKLCMADGFSLGSDAHVLKINCSKGGYYDSYLTNNIYEHRLRDKNGDKKSIAYASEAFSQMRPYSKKGDKYNKADISESDTLRAYRNTLLNNEFGVSTIAITRDNYIFQLIQSDRAQSSGQLIVPSGSGSCDYDDIRGDDFRKTITYAMQRELWEETGFKCPRKQKRQRIEKFGETHVIGFFRWLKRNGKPEMLGISYIDVNYNDIKPNAAEVKREAVLVDRIRTIDDLNEYLKRIKAQTHPIGYNDYDGVSVPLLALVIALEELLKDTEMALKVANVLRLQV